MRACVRRELVRVYRNVELLCARHRPCGRHAMERAAVCMHMCERFRVEAHSHAYAYVRAIQRRSARPCICICASGSVTKRTTAHLHMYKRFQDETHNCAYAHVQAPKDEARSHAHVRATIGEVRSHAHLHMCKRCRNESHSRSFILVQAPPQRIAQPCICTQMGDKCSAAYVPVA